MRGPFKLCVEGLDRRLDVRYDVHEFKGMWNTLEECRTVFGEPTHVDHADNRKDEPAGTPWAAEHCLARSVKEGLTLRPVQPHRWTQLKMRRFRLIPESAIGPPGEITGQLGFAHRQAIAHRQMCIG